VHQLPGIEQGRKREIRGGVEFDLHTYELQYHGGATRRRGRPIDLPVLLQGLLAISMLRLRFSGGIGEVRAFVGEEERSEIAEHGE
jgi:hypothetical protein